MTELKKGDYVKFKTNSHPDKRNGTCEPGQPGFGFGFVMAHRGFGLVDILVSGEFSDYRARKEDCEHIEGINAFDVIGHILRNRPTYDSLLKGAYPNPQAI